MFPEFERFEFEDQPFEHFIGHGGLSSAQSTEWLGWLQAEAPWKLTVSEFYEQYEFSLLDLAHTSA